MEGQLNEEDRALLYHSVLERKPDNIFEVGTFKGGGSTLQLARGLKENGKGLLFTCEIDPERYRQAVDGFFAEYLDLCPRINFCLGPALEMFPPILQFEGKADMVFMDGCDDGQTNLNEFLMFEPWMRPGSIFLMHDWGCLKASMVRPYLEKNPAFEILKVHDYVSVESGRVGMVKAMKL